MPKTEFFCLGCDDDSKPHASWCTLAAAEVDESPRAALMHAAFHRIPRVSRECPYFLGFKEMGTYLRGSDSRRYYDAAPAIPYRVDGLLVWGVTKDTLIHRLQIGSIECLRASEEPIPALLFSAGHSFEDFAKLIKNQVAPSVFMGELMAIPPHFAWQNAVGRTIGPAYHFTIEISGPIDTLASWGLAAVD